MSLNNIISILGIALAAVSAFKLFKDKKAVLYNITIAALGIGLLVASVIKNNADIKKSESLDSKSDSLQNTLNVLNSTQLELAHGLATIDTLKIYLKKLDSMGIKRDIINNQPLITKSFVNNIREVGTLNQY